MIEAEALNADGQAGTLNRAALQVRAPSDAWYAMVLAQCPHLFADVPVYISVMQLQQMKDVIAAVERVVNNSEWRVASSEWQLQNRKPQSTNVCAKGVFYGYDFHLNSKGVHLIEINTNAGGAFLNALLLDCQSEASLPGKPASEADLEEVFIDMFRREWQLERGDQPLTCVAIVDEAPEAQYLYPEFLLAQALFERAGIRALIVDPAEFTVRDQGLYAGELQVDLIYNRLTDFSLQQHPVLLNAWQGSCVVLTPNPAHYERYADKRNLARLTDADALHAMGATDGDIATLQSGIPHTFIVEAELENRLWDERKNLFFKPYRGYGSRGAYRGDKLTRRVFGEILKSGYVAQKLAPPGERRVGDILLKYDVRCYVYDGKIQLVAARLYQGQTTNFRTPGGGFASVRALG